MREGNVFTPVCHSVYRGVSASGSRGCTPPRHTPCWADTTQADTPWLHTPPPSRQPLPGTQPPAPPGRHPLWTQHTPPGHIPLLGRHPTGQTPPVEMTIEAGGTHLAGMHSCYRKVYSCLEKLSRSFEMSKNITVIDWKFNWPNNLKSIYNKNAFQQDAYRPLIDRMLKCASRGVCLVPGGLPGPGGVCLVPGGSAWSQGGLPVPGPGGSAWSGGVCLVCGEVCLVQGGLPGQGGPGGVCLVRWGLPGPGGGLPGPGGYIPACIEADTPLPPVDRQMPVKILPWPNFVAAGKNLNIT